MQAAASRVKAAGTQGSSTCCILLLDTVHGRLASANVGDSGFMILGVTQNNPRPHVKFRTPQQEHQFGCPYQLGHHLAADPPEDAMLTTLPVRPFGSHAGPCVLGTFQENSVMHRLQD